MRIVLTTLKEFCSYFQQKKSVNEFSKGTLKAYFGKYGDIESIEVIKPKKQEAEEITKSQSFAYVTFQSDISANAAVKDCDERILEKLECEYKV